MAIRANDFGIGIFYANIQPVSDAKHHMDTIVSGFLCKNENFRVN